MMSTFLAYMPQLYKKVQVKNNWFSILKRIPREIFVFMHKDVARRWVITVLAILGAIWLQHRKLLLWHSMHLLKFY